MNAQALTKETYAIPRLRKFSREALTPRMAGLMLSKAWVYVLFLAPLGVLEGPPVTTAAEFGSASRYMLIATLLGGAFLLSKRANAIPQNALAVLPGITSALGCLALVLAPMTPEATRTIVMAAAALTGIGSGILALMWGAVYSKVGAPTTAAEASLAFGLATLLVPGYSLCPSWTQFCIVIALPLGSSALLALVLNREQNVLEEDGANPADVKDKTEPGDLTNSAPHYLEDALSAKTALVKIAVYSIVFGFAIVLIRKLYEQQSASPLSSALIFAGSALVAASIVITVLMLSRHLDLAFSYRPVLILLAIGCFLLPFIEHGNAVPYFFARVGYVCFLIMNWVMLSDLAFRSSFSSFAIFGIGQAASSFGMTLGTAFSGITRLIGTSTFDQAQALSGLLVFVLLITHVLTTRNATVANSEDQTQGKDSSTRPHAATFRKRCAAVAEHYHLGERATEVMVLFAKGRSKARIEQELYISQSTVSFHLRNIYQKLGVHSRQELMDFIENYSVAEEDSYD